MSEAGGGVKGGGRVGLAVRSALLLCAAGAVAAQEAAPVAPFAHEPPAVASGLAEPTTPQAGPEPAAAAPQPALPELDAAEAEGSAPAQPLADGAAGGAGAGHAPPTDEAAVGAGPVAAGSGGATLPGVAGAESRAPAPAPEIAAALPRDLSPWGMFLAADAVVKGVMVGLVFASLVTWTVWFAKSLEILGAGARLGRARRLLLAAPDLAAAERAFAGRRGPVAAMIRGARDEVGASADGAEGLLGRVSSQLSRIEAQAGRRLVFGTGVLATIGATAPFVGLFGTVWGIMNSFIGISEAQTTNLAVVAPGIAEALLATALGLVAAIPAVVIYNLFARWNAGYRARLAGAAAALERLVSRDVDRRRQAPGLARAAE